MDAVLTYSLLKIVNSSYFALRNQAADVHQAIVVMIHFHNKCLLIQVLIINTSSNTLFLHTMGQIYNVADAGVSHCLKINLNVIKFVNNGEVAGRKLKIVYCQLVTLFRVPLHKPHGQGVNNHILPHLNSP